MEYLLSLLPARSPSRVEARILRLGGLSFGHGERGSATLYRGSGAEPPAEVQGAEPPVGGQRGSPTEAESSVAFEALAEEPNSWKF